MVPINNMANVARKGNGSLHDKLEKVPNLKHSVLDNAENLIK